jgi:hypothetical protein
MNWRKLWNVGKQLVTRGLEQVEAQVKHWTKPAPERQITGVTTCGTLWCHPLAE